MWAHDPWDTRVHSGRELADTVTWSSKHRTDYKLAMTRVFKLSEPTHSDILPSPRPYLLSVPKQCHQLEPGIQMPEMLGTSVIKHTAIR